MHSPVHYTKRMFAANIRIQITNEKRLGMGAKDTKAKQFLFNNERFADIFNYYLFDGRQVIRPEDLEERDTAEVLSLYGYYSRGH